MSDLYDSQKINELSAFFLTTHPWRTWTPTVTQSGAVTVTVTYAVIKNLVDMVFAEVELTVTGTGTAANAISIAGIPTGFQVAGAGLGSRRTIGVVNIVDQSTGTHHIGALVANGANDLRGITNGVGNFIGITPNFALANDGDTISFSARWQRAT